jgi:enamine deaminase RidA (YjgF/YER057c/UK114 family)
LISLPSDFAAPLPWTGAVGRSRRFIDVIDSSRPAARTHVLAEAHLVGTFETKWLLRHLGKGPDMIDFIDSDDLMRNKNFSQVAIASGSKVIYTSGQVSIDRDGKLVGGADLAAQTKQAMRNLQLALAAAGAAFADVVKTTTFVVDFKPEHREIITGAKESLYRGRKPPASALIGVSSLAKAEWLIEIEAVAVLD